MKTASSFMRWISGAICTVSTFSMATAFAQSDPPIIGSQPQDVVIPIGSTATFSVFVLSGTPSSFQWFQGTQLLAGAVSNPFQISNVTSAAAGTYTVVVNNGFGSVTSAPASLVVLPL